MRRPVVWLCVTQCLTVALSGPAPHNNLKVQIQRRTPKTRTIKNSSAILHHRPHQHHHHLQHPTRPPTPPNARARVCPSLRLCADRTACGFSEAQKRRLVKQSRPRPPPTSRSVRVLLLPHASACIAARPPALRCGASALCQTHRACGHLLLSQPCSSPSLCGSRATPRPSP